MVLSMPMLIVNWNQTIDKMLLITQSLDVSCNINRTQLTLLCTF